ncbi:serine/threonine-protein kinase [Streptomyces sp. NPDC096152]|uniref:serine/threonine-protein kinase n=1 Tax=Streptomyces sp. NPDC096152 TaxID=3366078 RepID=UPI00382F2C12
MTGPRTEPPPALAPGARPAPGYAILGHLARTGWLDVYDAWSEERACRCVVKVVRPDRLDEAPLRARLLREGRWLRGFTHPHLVRAYETFDAPEPLVVLETLTGETLSHLIHRLRRRPAAADVALLGVQLCSAAHYLHGKRLLHLDLKPSNVVVDRGHAKVLDLSVARAPGPAPPGVGTYRYLSPEQARGGTLSAAADVWGIGITLYEVAGGELPFDYGETADGTYGTYGTYGTGTPGEDGDHGAADPDERCPRPEADEWYPQLEASAPPITTRRRLPSALAAAVDACLREEPSARPTIPGLAEALAATLGTALPARTPGASPDRDPVGAPGM